MFSLKELCFEITSYCYQNCIYCSSFDDNTRIKKKSHLSFTLIKYVIDDFVYLGGERLELSGGEPLLHPDILKITSYAIKNGIKDIIIYTSGILPVEYNMLSLIKKLYENGVKKIVFNCQGIKQTHNKLVDHDNAFDKVISGIKLAKSVGFWVGIHFVPNKLNFSEVSLLYKVLNELKVDELAFLRLVKKGRAKKNWQLLEMNKNEYKSFFKQIYVLNKNKNFTKIRLGCPFDFMQILYPEWKKSHQCHAGKTSLNIMADGNVIPCPAFKDIKEAYLGKVTDNSLKKIWEEALFLKRIRSINELQIEFCNECKYLHNCKGRCLAQRFLQYHSLTKGPDPLCKLLELYQPEVEFKKYFAVSM